MRADDERRIELLRQVLARPDLAAWADLRAAPLGALAVSIASVNERTGSDDYEEAIAAIESPLAAQSRESAPGTWAVNTLNRGKFYARRGAGAGRGGWRAWPAPAVCHHRGLGLTCGAWRGLVRAGRDRLPLGTARAARVIS